MVLSSVSNAFTLELKGSSTMVANVFPLNTEPTLKSLSFEIVLKIGPLYTQRNVAWENR